MMTLAPRLAAFALAGLLLTGCGAAATVDSGSPSGTNRPASSATQTADKAPATSTAATAASATETPSATAEPTQDDGTASFGETYTWEDGLSISLSEPAAYTPSEYAAGVEKGKPSIVLTVTIVNKTGQPFEPGLVYLTAQSSNEEASQIFDSEKNISGGPSTKLLNGREVQFKVAFAVADPEDLVIEVTPDFEHQSVLFAS